MSSQGDRPEGRQSLPLRPGEGARTSVLSGGGLRAAVW